MKILTKKDGTEVLITEKEFISAISSMGNNGVYIPRIQTYFNTFDIVSIIPVPGQLDFGKPYLISDGVKFRDGRFFISNKGNEVMGQGGIIIGNYAELKDKMIPEDEYYDAIADKSKNQYPNNLLPKRSNIKELKGK